MREKFKNEMKYLLENKLLLSVLLSNLFYNISYPIIAKLLITNIEYKFISTRTIIVCLSAVIISILWQKYEEKCFKNYGKILYFEGIIYFFICMFLIKNNFRIFYILDALMYGIIARHIITGSNVLKQLIYDNPEKRKVFDMKEQMYIYVGLLLGSIICLLLPIDISLFVVIVLFIFGMIIDNIIYLKVYRKVKDNYRKKGDKK